MQKHSLDVIQLHGNETAEYCSLLKAQGFEIIKAFGVDDSLNFDNLNHYVPFIDYFLFDSRGKHAGGNGILFNWKTLFGKRFSKPFLLSGGISPNHIEALKEFNHPDCIGIDLNSRFEISTGLKDVVRIQSFLQKVAA
jgi:phosphoribosylanthranilate isomerase